MPTQPVRTALIGCGNMGRHHIRMMLRQPDTTRIVIMSDPSPSAYGAAAELFGAAGLQPPPNEPDLDRLLSRHSGRLDAAFIVTPHAHHHDQATACMEAGLDVLLEKPMAMNGIEARSLIQTRDHTG